MKKVLWATFIALALACQTTYAQSAADGMRYLDQEQFTNARKAFHEFYGKAQTAESAYYLGYFYLKMDNADSASIFFDKGIATDAKYALNYVGRGTVKYIKKDKTGSKADFDEALTISKRKNAEVMHRIGEAYIAYEVKDPSTAIDILNGNKIAKQKGAKELAPQDAEICLTLGDAFLERNNMNTIVEGNNDGGNAANNYTRALQINPKLAKAHMKKGNIWVRAKNYKLALEDYKKGIEANADYAPTYRGLGELYAKVGRYKEAAQYYNDYIKRSDGSTEALYRYAQFLYLINDYPKSLEMLKKVEGKVASANYQRLMAYCQYENKEYAGSAKSMEMFLSKVEKDKIIASDYEYKGRIAIATGGDTLRAAEDMHKAVDMDSTKTLIYSNLYEMFANTKKYKLAAQEMKMLMTKKKPDVNHYLSLGYAYQQDKDYVQADSTFAQANRLQESSDGLFWRASSSDGIDKDNKLGLSKPYWERFIEIAEKNDKNKTKLTKGYYMLARTAAVSGDLSKAEELAKKSLEIDPEYKSAKKMLETIAEDKKTGNIKVIPPKKEEKKK